MRPENMGTASSDGTMRMWMLKADCLPVWDSWHRTARYSKQDTRPVEDPARRFKDIWVYENAVGTLPTPFRNQEAPETPLLVGANGIGEWGRTESGPVFVNEDVDKSKGIVVDIRMSKLYPSLYYCCTSHGQLAAQTVRLDIQDNLQCYHKYNRAEDPIAFQLENYIYCRRLEDAKEDLEQLKAIPKEDIDDPEHMEKMIDHFQDCIKIRPAISPDDWQINSLPDKKNRRKSRRLWTNEDLADLAVSQFKQDLDYWSARIPPGYETRYHFPSDMGITMPREEETDTSARRHNIQITVDNEPVSEDQRHELEQEMEQEMLLTAQLTRTLSSATSTTRSPSTHSVHSLHHQAQDLLKKIPLARVFSRRQPKDQQEPNDTQGREEPLMPELQRNASTRRNALL
ncbi:uncharacterized protein BYT42DRAFT_260539 [Radiomyces spectabilis]|uniref:uncharacterized protein n=1 Tax=Radiomyces spectabilis TaxID=64574 RepID=UPI00221F9A52|nr:uncharacterized protein BYT42DRAFT_260539 [Radiomyces spectabilis]KAI8384424.1 hypothetical protein BYT42DRAFT_260539 [Radiomyces spectabilis]